MTDWKKVAGEYIEHAKNDTEEQFAEFVRQKAFPPNPEAQALDETNLVAFPEWIEDIAIDPNGDIYGFEGGCFFEGNRWNPVDDYDGLRYHCIGNLGMAISVDLAKTLHFELASQSTGNPYDFPARPNTSL